MFKIYQNGNDFIKENIELIEQDLIANSFMILNSKAIGNFTKDTYIFKFFNKINFLLAVYLSPYNLLLYGSDELIEECVNTLCDYNLSFTSVLCEPSLGEKFLQQYEKRKGGYHKEKHRMDVMICKKTNIINYKNIIEKCSLNDVNQLYELRKKFHLEAMHEEVDDNFFEKVKNEVESFYAIKDGNRIVSLCALVRDDEKSCGISSVFTIEEARGKGYAQELVAYVTNLINKKGKIAYLYVDKANPISNHVYSKIGYEYGQPRTHYDYFQTNIKSLILCGGCFWCMAKPYYEYNGVKKVLSGFVGGSQINPTYEEVKNHKTAHREAILIEYDCNVISSQQLIDIYITTINPFDGEGQFIDRGYNYTCGVYSSSFEVIEYINSKIEKLEKEYNQKVYIDLCPDTVFFKAEEYHQDYAIKNKELMEKELILSGRKQK